MGGHVVDITMTPSFGQMCRQYVTAQQETVIIAPIGHSFSCGVWLSYELCEPNQVLAERGLKWLVPFLEPYAVDDSFEFD